MNLADITVLAPFIIVAVTGVAVMLVAAFYRNHCLAVATTVVGLICALAAISADYSLVPRQVTPLLTVDGLTLFFSSIIILATIATALLCYEYLGAISQLKEEMYILLLFGSLGAMTVVASSHFASFFIGLEILGVSLYAAIAYSRNDPLGIEAAIKYLILAATSDAILLFGMAMLYSQFGTLEFAKMGALFAAAKPGLVTLAGAALLVVGIGFKLSLVPFHMWTPDVYEGAPAPVTGFLATVSKGAVFAVLLRYFIAMDFHRYDALTLVFSVIAIASMVGGNLLALLQDNVKRMLGYASIAHMGYLLVAFMAAPAMAAQAAGYYFAAYFAATLGAFGVIGLIEGESSSRSSCVNDFRGLFWRIPVLAGFFTVMLLSMAGIPLTAGFLGKFYVMAAGVQASLWTLIAVFIGTGVIGLYYYLRIIASMCLPIEEGDATQVDVRSERTSQFVLVVLTLAVLILGILPGQLIGLLQRSMPF